MPSFMPIGPKLWALEGYTQTNKQTNKPSYFNYIDIEYYISLFSYYRKRAVEESNEPDSSDAAKKQKTSDSGRYKMSDFSAW